MTIRFLRFYPENRTEYAADFSVLPVSAAENSKTLKHKFCNLTSPINGE